MFFSEIVCKFEKRKIISKGTKTTEGSKNKSENHKKSKNQSKQKTKSHCFFGIIVKYAIL